MNAELDPPRGTTRSGGLNRERIVSAAIELADRQGLEKLSMRRLAESMGAGAMSLYRHFRSKDELLDAMADAVMSESAPATFDPSAAWVDVARDTVRRFRQILLSHPGVAPILVRRPPVGPNTFRAVELSLTWLRSVGFDEADAPRVFQALVTYVLGAVSLEAPFRDPSGPSITEQAAWLRRRYESLPASEFPHTVAMADSVFIVDADSQFEFGLDLLLEALEARLNVD